MPFVIALIVLGFILWMALRVMIYPHDGIGYIHPTGLIGEIDPIGPNADKIQVNDLILSIDSVPWEEAYYF